MLEIDHLTKKYGAKAAVNDLSFSLEPGRLAVLLGPNGSGKTTLMKMIAGLATPTAGAIRLDGVPVGRATKAHVAYMPTEAYFYGYMTALDAGKYYRDFFADFDMDKYILSLEKESLDLKGKIRTMSSGMVAKVKLALTFARSSRLVMLDEPLNGIDIVARERTLEAIQANRGEGRTMIVSSHLVDELETMIDDAIFIKDGALVVAGDAKALREKHGMSIVDMYMRIYGEGAAFDA
ncbi:MAG: ABC transporter ATP-binding protein [Clostridia bacterium]|nr:ABC transporter ATP-binding protein [Clostridia bacterium]